VNLARFALALVPQARREARWTRPVQYLAFLTGIALSSAALGVIVVLSWPLLDPARIAIVAVVTSGLVSGAVMSVGFSPLVYLVYMLPPVGALFAMAVTDTRAAWGADILATSFAIYAAAVVVISLDQRRTRRKAIALELQLSDLVVRDTLTQLHNRRFLQEFMAVESARIARDASDLAHGRLPTPAAATGIFMMDLDLFKQVNDNYGHLAGDHVLRSFSMAIHRSIRNEDVFARYGGEEFAVISRAISLDDTYRFAERLRSVIEKMQLEFQGYRILLTVSIGIAALPALDTTDPAAMVDAADRALYWAKTHGRNQVVVYRPGLDERPFGEDDTQVPEREDAEVTARDIRAYGSNGSDDERP
jgi:diguanylate cyclase (GGDEF)-like protein